MTFKFRERLPFTSLRIVARGVTPATQARGSSLARLKSVRTGSIIAAVLVLLASATANAWQSNDVRDFPEAYRNCNDNDCRSAIWKSYGPEQGLNTCWVAAGNNSEVYAIDTLDSRYAKASRFASNRRELFQKALGTDDSDALPTLALVLVDPTHFFAAQLDDAAFSETPCNNGEVDGWARCGLDRGLSVLNHGTGAYVSPEDSWTYHFSPGCYAKYSQYAAQLDQALKETLTLPSIASVQTRAEELVKRLASKCNEQRTFDACVPLQRMLLSEKVQTLMGNRCKVERDSITRTIKGIDDREWAQASGSCRALKNESACLALNHYIAVSQPPVYGAHLNEATKLRSKAHAALEHLADQRIAKAKYERRLQIVADCG